MTQTPREFESSFMEEVKTQIGTTDELRTFWEAHPELKAAMEVTANLLSGHHEDHIGQLEGRKWFGEHILPLLVRQAKEQL